MIFRNKMQFRVHYTPPQAARTEPVLACLYVLFISLSSRSETAFSAQKDPLRRQSPERVFVAFVLLLKSVSCLEEAIVVRVVLIFQAVFAVLGIEPDAADDQRHRDEDDGSDQPAVRTHALFQGFR